MSVWKGFRLPTFAYEIGYLQAGLANLEPYLLSNVLYWPMDASPPEGQQPYPLLTLDGLLLARARLKAMPLTLTQQAELGRLLPELDLVRSRWRVAWENKAAQAFGARLNLWRNFIEDYRQDPAAHRDRYAYEVRQRVMLHLLVPEAASLPPAQLDLLAALDLVLKNILEPADFIWDADLQPGFPEADFWYLYGRLPRDLARAADAV